MIIQLDQTGHVLGYADTLAEGVTLPGGLEIDFEPDGDFYKNYFQYLYQDGKLVKDCQTISEGQKEQIRARRQAECGRHLSPRTCETISKTCGCFLSASG